MKYKVTLNNVVYEVEVADGEAILLEEYETAAAPAPVLAVPPAQNTAPVQTPAPVQATAPVQTPAPVQASAPAQNTAVSGETVSAPMPGVILGIKVQEGAAVKKGDTLLILEAMKMENEISAPRDAKIVQILTNKGASVDTGTPLVVLG